jgi:hypothetical protein
MADTTKGRRFTASVVAGLILVPAAAAAAVFVVGHDLPAEAQVELAAPAESPPESAAVTGDSYVIDPVTASAADLAAACGADGMHLVSLESEQLITQVQQAALDALRQLCAESGMALPAPPAPPPIVQTVTKTTETPEVDDTDEADDDSHEDDDEYEDEDSEGSESEYLAAYRAAADAIDLAREEAGDSEKIREAEKKLREAEAKAAKADWDDATEKADEARRKAVKALDVEDED